MAEIAIGIATELGVKAFEKVLAHISTTVKREISLVGSLDKNIELLRENLPVVKDVMLNAQAAGMSSQRSLILNSKVFFKGLKQFLYDGEDIVDEFDLQIRRGLMNKMQKWKIARKLKKLYAEFEDLTEKNQNAEKFLKVLKDNLSVPGDEVGSRLPLLRRRPSISMIQRQDFNMVGRDEDKEWLLHDLLENKLKPSVLLLTGMGGIGKTTLARDILHQPQIVSHFAFRKWVTVGDRNLDSKKVLNQMIVSGPADTLNEASEKVRSDLEGKKRFLIVLDDVWEAEDLKHRWNELWVPLSYGGEGSRVIVTTRETNIRRSMEGLVPQVRELKILSDDQCLKIFESFAFPDECDIIHLREIGKKIVNQKVRGVPLAARVIGSSLNGKPYSHWNAALYQIKESDINSAILWSYLNLSMHLKQCFVYCSLFPKDSRLDKTEIVRLWMAHSFVVESSTQCNGGLTLVDIGESYFDALVNASLLQVVQDDDDGHEYIMHDLIHDFALNILGDEFSKDKDSMKSLRHLIIEENDQALPQNHSDIKNLGTFMSKDPLHINYFTRDQLKTVKYLSIPGEYFDVSKTFITKTFITKLLKKLSQVRYLNISRMKISTLPESVCSMCALQTLVLKDGDTIQFPKAMSKKLVELHHIEAGDNVSRISGLGQLKKLHSIGGRFILYEDNWQCIEELRNLKQLRGKLEIKGLGHVQCSQLVCKEDILENHRHLEELVFDMDGVTASQVLNYLRPHGNLKALEIKNYRMVQLPTWLGNEKFNIVSLELFYCSVKKLPPLGCLPRLENLFMWNLDKIEQIDGEFYGSSTHVVSSCNSLQALPKELPSSLKNLRINSCNSLQALPKELPSSLKDLWINSCDSLQALPKELPSSLRNLKIWGCNSLQALPKELPSSLKYLLIDSCNSLQALPKELPSSLEYLEIRRCNSLQALPKELPSSLETLVIGFCNSLQALPKELLSSLKDLWIISCNSLQALPKELPSSLRVHIEDCLLLPRKLAKSHLA